MYANSSYAFVRSSAYGKVKTRKYALILSLLFCHLTLLSEVGTQVAQAQIKESNATTKKQDEAKKPKPLVRETVQSVPRQYRSESGPQGPRRSSSVNVIRTGKPDPLTNILQPDGTLSEGIIEKESTFINVTCANESLVVITTESLLHNLTDEEIVLPGLRFLPDVTTPENILVDNVFATNLSQVSKASEVYTSPKRILISSKKPIEKKSILDSLGLVQKHLTEKYNLGGVYAAVDCFGLYPR